MLVSYRKNFIFTKTTKTAGTSVEAYFEKYCMPDGEWELTHAREEYVSETGIIGYRGTDPSHSTWYNHMPAKSIRDLLGQEIWEHCFKFTVIRNPFDKMVSGFHYYEKIKQNRTAMERVKAAAKKILNREWANEHSHGETEIDRFRSWVREGGWGIDRDKYMIDGVECVDYFIRFERLHEGIKHVCDRLSLPFEPSMLPWFKKGGGHHKTKIQDYFDDETRQLVQNMYAWELERFGYDLPKSKY